MKYCVECGSRLTEKYLEKEGMIPYCESCQAYRFPIFHTAVSMIVYDTANDKVLLIKQYGRPHYILVAGYINRQESAEQAVRREVYEEVHLRIDKLVFNESAFYEPSNTLMMNFICYVSHPEELAANEEVDSYAWFSLESAKEQIKPESLARRFLYAFTEK